MISLAAAEIVRDEAKVAAKLAPFVTEHKEMTVFLTVNPLTINIFKKRPQNDGRVKAKNAIKNIR